MKANLGEAGGLEVLAEQSRQLADVNVRFRAAFAYVEGALADGEVLKLCLLRYAGSASPWRPRHPTAARCSALNGSVTMA